MYIHFDSFNMQPETFIIEIEVDGQVNTQHLYAPPMLAQQEFIDLYNHLGRMTIPARVKFSKECVIWSQFEQTKITRENSVEFRNNSWVTCYGDTY